MEVHKALQLALIAVGLFMTVVGIIPNFWTKGEMNVGDFIKRVSIDHNTTVQEGNESTVEFHSGLWYYCYDVPSIDSVDQLHKSECHLYQSESPASPVFTRLFCLASLLLEILGFVLAWMEDYKGVRICKGVAVLLAGALGLAGVGLYQLEDIDGYDLPETEADWAIWLYGAGCGLQLLIGVPLTCLACTR